MKYIFFLLVVLFFAGYMAEAQFSLLPPPGMTPDSPFYFFERLSESIGTFFTFGNENKTARFIALAEERLSEVVFLARNGRSDIEETVMSFENAITHAGEYAEKANSIDAKIAVLESLAKHFAAFEEILNGVSEQTRVSVEHAFEENRKLQKRFLFEVAGTDPLHAAELGFLSVRERLTKLKSEIELGRRYEVILITDHIKDIFDVLLSAAAREETQPKDFLLLLANDTTRTLEAFDDIERSSKVSADALTQITELKARLIDLEIGFLRNMIVTDPSLVVAVLREAMQSRTAAFIRLLPAEETEALVLLSEYEKYLLFSREAITRVGRYFLDREENKTVSGEIDAMLFGFEGEIRARRNIFSPPVQEKIDMLLGP